MNCPNCGMELGHETEYCINCGAKQAKAGRFSAKKREQGMFNKDVVTGSSTYTPKRPTRGADGRPGPASTGNPMVDEWLRNLNTYADSKEFISSPFVRRQHGSLFNKAARTRNKNEGDYANSANKQSERDLEDKMSKSKTKPSGGGIGSASGGRAGSVSGGRVGSASGGRVGSASGSGAGSASGGRVGSAPGGRVGSASGSGAGSASGGGGAQAFTASEFDKIFSAPFSGNAQGGGQKTSRFGGFSRASGGSNSRFKNFISQAGIFMFIIFSFAIAVNIFTVKVLYPQAKEFAYTESAAVTAEALDVRYTYVNVTRQSTVITLYFNNKAGDIALPNGESTYKYTSEVVCDRDDEDAYIYMELLQADSDNTVKCSVTFDNDDLFKKVYFSLPFVMDGQNVTRDVYVTVEDINWVQ